ncbi:MAG: T9SS type A sorting domain-containing protein, partial [Bacteroidia bacterium]|nr:T9SS type A sorting domain-containing protein [Bacteroidia bacterium]
IRENPVCPEDKTVYICQGGCVDLDAEANLPAIEPGEQRWWVDLVAINTPRSPVCPTSTTTYTMIRENEYGCQCSFDIVVNVQDYDTTDLAFNGDTICENEQYCINLSNFDSDLFFLIDDITFSFDEATTADDIYFDLTGEVQIFPSLVQCYTYPGPGTYIARVTINGPCGTFEVTRTVVVLPVVETLCERYLHCDEVTFVDLTDPTAFLSQNCCPEADLTGPWNLMDVNGQFVRPEPNPNNANTADLLAGGYYELEYIDSENCTKCTFRVHCWDGEPATLGEEGFTGVANNALRLYPNPSHGKLDVLLSGGEKINQVRVLSVDGKLIKTLQLDGTSGSVNVDLDAHAPGVYFIQVQTANKLYSGRVILK